MTKFNNKIDFAKIIYFDEEASTNLIYQKNKGNIINSISNEHKTNKQFSMDGGISKIFHVIPFFKIKGNIDSNARYDKKSNKIINQLITNTLLTDYIELLNNDNSNGIIKIFKNASVFPHAQSLTYMKFFTPYFEMIEGNIPMEEVNLNISKIDQAINNGKGYFEMILNEENISVLRFNLKSFRNSYSLIDLTKMQLTYHAIEVGLINLNELDVQHEFMLDKDKIEDAIDIKNKEHKELNQNTINLEEVKVYDVIFAGIQIGDSND